MWRLRHRKGTSAVQGHTAFQFTVSTRVQFRISDPTPLSPTNHSAMSTPSIQDGVSEYYSPLTADFQVWGKEGTRWASYYTKKQGSSSKIIKITDKQQGSQHKEASTSQRQNKQHSKDDKNWLKNIVYIYTFLTVYTITQKKKREINKRWVYLICWPL